MNEVFGHMYAYLFNVYVGRVHDIMVRDSNKDPASDPTALLAKILINQVGLAWSFLSSKLYCFFLFAE